VVTIVSVNFRGAAGSSFKYVKKVGTPAVWYAQANFVFFLCFFALELQHCIKGRTDRQTVGWTDNAQCGLYERPHKNDDEIKV